MLAGRIGEVEVRVADAGVDAQPERQATDASRCRRSCADRVEDHLVGDLGDRGELVGVPGDAVGVHLLAEPLAAEARLVQRAARRAVEVLGSSDSNTPHVEKHLRASTDLAPDSSRTRPTISRLLLEAALVDQVVGRAKGHAQLLDGDGKQGGRRRNCERGWRRRYPKTGVAFPSNVAGDRPEAESLRAREGLCREAAGLRASRSVRDVVDRNTPTRSIWSWSSCSRAR